MVIIGNILNSLRYSQAYSENYKIMQGSTYGTVFMDLNNMVYDKHNKPYANQDDLLRRLYVAASRTQKELIICYGH